MYDVTDEVIMRSEALFAKAQQIIPGGVNSPVRAFKAVGGTPRFIKSAKGAYLIDEDNQKYIDYVCSWGAMILGHAHPEVVKAAHVAIENGFSFGAPTALEVSLAEEICRQIPSIEKIRFVNSGTEATMTAIRLCRGVTGRSKILKFAGCYHGHNDTLLVNAGSGALTFGVPSSPGVTNATAADTLTASYNDLDSVDSLFEKYGHDIAAIIVEPIACNMNLVLPIPEFLSGLRQICDRYGALLIFDEVITGFRVGPVGAQGIFNVRPDITTLGKIIGGGMPIGAVGGSVMIMDQLSPQGPIYQAGTLSGNPISMAVGLATLQQLKIPGAYEQLTQVTHELAVGISERARFTKISLTVQSCCGLIGLFFTNEKNILSFDQVMQCNQHKYKHFFHALLTMGVYLAPSSFEAGFISLAHHQNQIQETLHAVEKALFEVKNI